MSDALRLVNKAFVNLSEGTAQNLPRRRLVLPTGAVLHSLVGSCGPYFGTKTYGTHARHGAWFHVVLYSADTARPLAIIEANHLGRIRTGAATGVATNLLAPPEADVLGMIGCGYQADAQLEAVCAVRRIREVRVWSRDAQRREAFARDCAERFGVTVLAAPSTREAVEGAPIVVTMTNAREPVLDAAWIAPGAHVNAAGSNQARRRELPAELLDRAGIIAVDSLEQARVESGDLLMAWPDGEWPMERLVELQEVAAGRRGRTSPTEVTIFKSNGLGVEDIAAAGHVYEMAASAGVGEQTNLLAEN